MASSDARAISRWSVHPIGITVTGRTDMKSKTNVTAREKQQPLTFTMVLVLKNGKKRMTEKIAGITSLPAMSSAARTQRCSHSDRNHLVQGADVLGVVHADHIDDIHDSLTTYTNREMRRLTEARAAGPIESPQWLRNLNGTQVGQYVFIIPEDGVDIVKWGASLSNCMGGYVDMVRRGMTHVGVLMADGRPKFGIEITKNKQVQQFSAYGNVTTGHETLYYDFLRAVQLTEAPHAWAVPRHNDRWNGPYRPEEDEWDL